ncbi:unnamed protein product [Cuscuta campestris]|uniref:Integrase catalytic domain-containing protein n=1 Tax=Cuscuta campestris TaxID=132261 RepID=A0A484LWN1_9ASTE|nr:unnamed protein product [Cuscuta campestris]
MNRGVEEYLHAYVVEKPKQWLLLLPWAEFAINTSYHSGLRMTPFQALYGRAPPSILPYSGGECEVPAVDELLSERTALLHRLRDNLHAAQEPSLISTTVTLVNNIFLGHSSRATAIYMPKSTNGLFGNF